MIYHVLVELQTGTDLKRFSSLTLLAAYLLELTTLDPISVKINTYYETGEQIPQLLIVNLNGEKVEEVPKSTRPAHQIIEMIQKYGAHLDKVTLGGTFTLLELKK